MTDNKDDVPDVYWVGHHNSASFGAIPYLFRTHDNKWIMVDTPKYGSSAIRAVTSLTGPKGPDFLVLTHVDDTADHLQWANHFAPILRRIFHSGDLGRHNWLGDKTLEDVEVLAERLAGEGSPDHSLEQNLRGNVEVERKLRVRDERRVQYLAHRVVVRLPR